MTMMMIKIITMTIVIIQIAMITMAATSGFHHIQIHADLLCIDLAFSFFHGPSWKSAARGDPVRTVIPPKVPQTSGVSFQPPSLFEAEIPFVLDGFPFVPEIQEHLGDVLRDDIDPFPIVIRDVFSCPQLAAMP